MANPLWDSFVLILQDRVRWREGATSQLHLWMDEFLSLLKPVSDVLKLQIAHVNQTAIHRQVRVWIPEPGAHNPVTQVSLCFISMEFIAAERAFALRVTTSDNDLVPLTKRSTPWDLKDAAKVVGAYLAGYAWQHQLVSPAVISSWKREEIDETVGGDSLRRFVAFSTDLNEEEPDLAIDVLVATSAENAKAAVKAKREYATVLLALELSKHISHLNQFLSWSLPVLQAEWDKQ